MRQQEKTVLDLFNRRKVSRRDFLQFCAFMAAAIGLESTAVPQIAAALETKPRPPVIWLHFQECTGCSESFLRTSHPILADVIFDLISLDYHETLQAAAGLQAEEAKLKAMTENKGKYILCVEGSIPAGENGQYCTIGGKPATKLLAEAAKDCAAVIAWGSCAANGGLPAANPNPTGAKTVDQLVKGKPVINVPGCPPIAEVMAGVIVHYLTFDKLPELDFAGRPKAFYDHRIHDKCNRRAYYDAGMFAEKFDDEGAKQGWCLYKLGCKGPTTFNSCSTIRWNNGTSYPIQSGHPCIGCSEENFWDNGPFYTHLADMPGMKIGWNADQIGLAATAVTVGGIAVHTAATTVIKGKEKKSEQKGGNG
ncbi:MAG: hydrogenase small subunit [Heliobacteriaceae bacterium]|nr:hydrogenase small subunit [Heliobacteriaceae bacterium]MDD4587081.1 hydrogenase small subunit [Heliobacteriaceae bacterium]